MPNGIVILIQQMDKIYTGLTIHTRINDLLDTITDVLENVTDTFANFVSAIYFIFGKPLVIWFIGVVGIIIGIRILMAIVNLIYP